MATYHYTPLCPGTDSVRLLRLLPHEDETAPLQSQLFNYSLQESDKICVSYEALSYVWGNPDRPMSISIDGRAVAITVNLHAALSCLRGRSVERVIWVDAICINQEDAQERGHQVRSMVKVFGRAERVIVWLGEEAEDSYRAFEEIGVAASKKSLNSSNNDKTVQQAVLALFQRSWFRRIWVRELTLDTLSKI